MVCCCVREVWAGGWGMRVCVCVSVVCDAPVWAVQVASQACDHQAFSMIGDSIYVTHNCDMVDSLAGASTRLVRAAWTLAHLLRHPHTELCSPAPIFLDTRIKWT